MTKVQTYYQKVYERFDSKTQNRVDNQASKEHPVQPENGQNHQASRPDRSKINQNASTFKERNMEHLGKCSDELLESYLLNNNQLSNSTAKRHREIITKFKIFSPLLIPEDFASYLQFKFIDSTSMNARKPLSKATYRKYKSILTKFLNFIYDFPPNFFNKQNLDIKPLVNYSKRETCTKTDILNLYNYLKLNGQYDDALLVQWCYSLALSPDNLEMLSYGNVDINGFLHYRDQHTGKFDKIKLDHKLISFILFLLDYKGKDHIVKVKTSKYGYSDKGLFFFNISSSGIYKRFERRFGAKKNQTIIAPSQIININRKRIHNNKRTKSSIEI